MANRLKLKRSAVPGKVPTTADLDLGEIAINTYDGKAYMKKNVGGVESIVLLVGAGSGDVNGPASSTDNAFARFDGISGKAIKNSSGATLDDSGNATFATQISTGTGANKMPVGTSAQRPTGQRGMYRFNETTGQPEWYDSTGGVWVNFADPLTYPVEFMLIGGGGAGGGNTGGGGGGGGYVTGTATVSAGQAIAVTIGAGGTGNTGNGSNGGNSSFGGYVAIGGGGGGGLYTDSAPARYGANGGSGGGGGGAGNDGAGVGYGGSGTSGQGTGGGNTGSSPGSCIRTGAGGGGAAASGGNASGQYAGGGGAGAYNAMMGAYYCGGGGGGNTNYSAYGCGGDIGGAGGGAGGGGTGGYVTGGYAGTVNSGGGGGGGGWTTNNARVGGNGGSGLFVLRYPGPQRGTGGSVVTSGGYTWHTFNSSGTFTP